MAPAAACLISQWLECCSHQIEFNLQLYESRPMISNLIVSTLLLSHVASAQIVTDDSAINTRDRNAQALTADQQGMSSNDTKITADIRKEIMKINSLSVYAQNIKIITVNGLVTLRGPVRSTDEQMKILEVARRVAGSARVTNQIEIAPEKTKN